jgi:hypothetical protein
VRTDALMAAGFLLLALPLLGLPGMKVEAQSWSDFQASRQAQAESALSVEVVYGAGQFSLSPARSDRLYQVRMRYDEESFQPTHSYQNGVLRVGTEGSSSGRRTFRRGGDFSESELELRLGGTVPTDLKLELGAVRSDMDLGGIRLRSINLATGASDTRVRVSRPNPIQMDSAVIQVGAAAFEGEGLGRLRARQFKVDAGVGDVRLDFGGLERSLTRLNVSMGLGSVHITIPTGVGIRLTRSTFLTSVTAPDLTQHGEAYLSRDWDDAERQIEIQVDAAFGSVTIRREGG